MKSIFKFQLIDAAVLIAASWVLNRCFLVFDSNNLIVILSMIVAVLYSGFVLLCIGRNDEATIPLFSYQHSRLGKLEPFYFQMNMGVLITNVSIAAIAAMLFFSKDNSLYPHHSNFYINRPIEHYLFAVVCLFFGIAILLKAVLYGTTLSRIGKFEDDISFFQREVIIENMKDFGLIFAKTKDEIFEENIEKRRNAKSLDNGIKAMQERRRERKKQIKAIRENKSKPSSQDHALALYS